MEEATVKMFNCPECGPKAVCYVHGEWVNKLIADMVFSVTRPSFDEFSAKLNHGRSAEKPDLLALPRILAEVEEYAEEARKFQCCDCGKVFVIPKRMHEQGAVAGTAATTLGTAITNTNPFAGGGGQPFTLPPNAFFPGPGPQAGPVPTPAMVGPGNQAIWMMIDTKFNDAELDDIIKQMGFDPAAFADRAAKIDHMMDALLG